MLEEGVCLTSVLSIIWVFLEPPMLINGGGSHFDPKPTFVSKTVLASFYTEIFVLFGASFEVSETLYFWEGWFLWPYPCIWFHFWPSSSPPTFNVGRGRSFMTRRELCSVVHFYAFFANPLVHTRRGGTLWGQHFNSWFYAPEGEH